ncbi:MAG TPA: helix-turn-helix domain-containing protein [Burkholderiaceae bacterium]|jgi:transcriptional regulator GlxA family with amidase domain
MIDVLFLVLPDSLLLDLAGPAEAFRLANQRLRHAGRAPAFRMRFVGPLAEVESSVGLGLAKIEPLPPELPPRCWVVVLGRPGSAPEVLRRQRPWLTARDWLARVVAPRLDADDTLLLTVCVGALLAADAGLVGTRCVTTHHELLDELARLAPAAKVQANRVFVEDGPLLSSAGITAGIDLALHLVTRECGPAIASAVAQVMVAFTRRGPHDEQRSPLLAHRDHLHPAVHRVQDAVCAAPSADWSAERLAETAHVTPRHLARLFHRHVKLSPRDYVEHVRRGLARHALAGGASNADAARLAGFESPRRLRQALKRPGAARAG